MKNQQQNDIDKLISNLELKVPESLRKYLYSLLIVIFCYLMFLVFDSNSIRGYKDTLNDIYVYLCLIFIPYAIYLIYKFNKYNYSIEKQRKLFFHMIILLSINQISTLIYDNFIFNSMCDYPTYCLEDYPNFHIVLLALLILLNISIFRLNLYEIVCYIANIIPRRIRWTMLYFLLTLFICVIIMSIILS